MYFESNPNQLDVDKDLIGDVCDDVVSIKNEIPKGFTPNNDGLNDYWVIEYIDQVYPNNKVEVYNRSGQLVYSAESYKNDWNGGSNTGITKGKLPSGSYMFIVQSGNPVLSNYPKAYVSKGWIYIKY